jgi:hypothetical protein
MSGLACCRHLYLYLYLYLYFVFVFVFVFHLLGWAWECSLDDPGSLKESVRVIWAAEIVQKVVFSSFIISGEV